MTRKTISKKANSKGTVFALVSDGVNWRCGSCAKTIVAKFAAASRKHGDASRQQWASRRRVTCSPAEAKGRNDERDARTNPGALKTQRTTPANACRGVGSSGELGACIYCGKQVDAITAYSDRANSCYAAKAP